MRFITFGTDRDAVMGADAPLEGHTGISKYGIIPIGVLLALLARAFLKKPPAPKTNLKEALAALERHEARKRADAEVEEYMERTGKSPWERAHVRLMRAQRP